jgi:sugar lactone lactonase YvrE
MVQRQNTAVQSRPIPNLIQGVTQQAPQQQRDTQCAEQFDCRNSSVEGCLARPGADLIGWLYNITLGEAWCYDIKRSEDEHYLVVVYLDTGVGRLRVFNMADFSECSVSFNAGDGHEAYLTAVALDPKDAFCAATIDDSTFIANKEIKPVVDPEITEPRPLEALFYVRAGNYLTRYQISIIAEGAGLTNGRLAGTMTMPKGGTAANINDDSTATTATTGAIGNLSGLPVGSRIIAKLDLGSDLAVTSVKAVNIKKTGSTARNVSFLWSTNGTSWNWDGNNYSINTTDKTLTRSYAVNARYWAIVATDVNWGTETITIADFNVYGPVAGATNTLRNYTWRYTTPDNSVAGNGPYILTQQIAATFYRAMTGAAAVPLTSGDPVATVGDGVGAGYAGDPGGSGTGQVSVVDDDITATSLGFRVDLNGNVIRVSRQADQVTGGTMTTPLGGTPANLTDNDAATGSTTNNLGDLTAAAFAARIIAKYDTGSVRPLTRVFIEDVRQSGTGVAGEELEFWVSKDDVTYTKIGETATITGTDADTTLNGLWAARYVVVVAKAANWAATVTIDTFNVYEGTKPFDIDTADGNGDTLLKGIKGVVNAFSELPARGFDGFVVKVKGENQAEVDDYYVRYVQGQTAGSSFWEECPKPGIPFKFDRTTMPYRLINGGLNVFSFQQAEWGERVAGDGENTAKDPSFVGKNIQELAYDHNRLCIITEGSAVWSKKNNPFVYFPDTVQTRLADAPIDLSISGTREVALLRRLVHHDETSFLWGTQVQSRVVSQGQEPFTEASVDIRPSTSYEFNERAAPLALGVSLYFATNNGDFSTVRDVAIVEGKARGETDVTGHVPLYIPKNIRYLTGSDTSSIIVAFSEETPSFLYVYDFFIQDNARLQSAWNIWRLPSSCVVKWCGIYRNMLKVLVQRPDGIALLSVNLQTKLKDPEGTYLTRMDFRINESSLISSDYNSGTGRTTIRLPYRLAEAEPTPSKLLVVGRDGDERGINYPVVSVSADAAKGAVVVVTGDIRQAWSISSAVQVNTFDLTASNNNPRGICFSADGTKLFVVGDGNDEVKRHTLSTAWNVATAGASDQSFSIAGQETGVQDIFFRADGLKMYVVGTTTGDAVYEYTLSVAWDVTTAVYVQSKSVAAQETNPVGLSFSPDGLYLFVVGTVNDQVYRYELTTAWDLSTATYSGHTSGWLSGAPQSLYMSPDGKKLYLTDNGDDSVKEYSLIKAWDLTDIVWGSWLSLGATDPSALFFKPDGSRLYSSETISNLVTAYDLTVEPHPLYIGAKISAEREDGEFYSRTEAGAEAVDELVVTEYRVVYALTGYTKAQVTMAAGRGGPFVYETPGPLASLVVDPDDATMNGTLIVPIGAVAPEFRVRLINDSFLPSAWQTGRYSFTIADRTVRQPPGRKD